MVCSPPYCNGSGSWCGCNCNCCPPVGCCKEVVQTHECGTRDIYWEGTGSNQGCSCAPLQPEPLFWFDFSNESEFVWALSGCEIPCQTVDVLITTSGCCFQIRNDGQLTVVGSGTVTATIQGNNNLGACGIVDPYVNGQMNSKSLNNCDIAVIELVPRLNPCCTCCLRSDLVVCRTTLGGGPLMLRKNNIQNGQTKLYLNKKSLLQRINKLH